MKAMLLKTPQPVEANPLVLSNLPTPSPGSGEILVRTRACGVCHTDLHTAEGEILGTKMPIIPGHQVVGYVEKLGSGVRRFKRGNRVGIPWLYKTCGRCTDCLTGHENLCGGAQFTGYHVNGGYAQYIVVSEPFACTIPDKYDDYQAAPLLCAGIIGYRAIRISELKPEEKLGLFGFGASAHIVIQIAKHWGCHVYVFSRSDGHRKLAEQLGAAWTGSSEQSPPVPLDRAILFAPAGRLILDALRNLRRGGTLAIAAVYLDRIPEMDYTTHLYGERTIRSVTASTRKDGEELLSLATQIPIHTQIQTFPLQDANQALQLLKAGKINGAGVLEIQ
ncbi:MAG: zinc-dependent alcohol dehydrogenase family protein [Nitrospira sp.]|nr:zinc-dependent alcohol dehydrogenase family protein [Nitrospira sp.]